MHLISQAAAMKEVLFSALARHQVQDSECTCDACTLAKEALAAAGYLERACPGCGGRFVPSHIGKEYCSEQCSNRYRVREFRARKRLAGLKQGWVPATDAGEERG